MHPSHLQAVLASNTVTDAGMKMNVWTKYSKVLPADFKFATLKFGLQANSGDEVISMHTVQHMFHLKNYSVRSVS